MTLRWTNLRTLWLRINQSRRRKRWNRQYAAGDWAWLTRPTELARYSVLAGYALELRPGGRLLDVGCGEGLLRDRLHPRAFSEYVGIDFEEAILRAAARLDERTRFIAADMNFFEPDGSFDCIVFNESLYLFRDVTAGMERYERFLAPKGIFLVSMHGGARMQEIWSLLEERYHVIDDVTITNRDGSTWTCKALGHVDAHARTESRT
ncbi:MAG: class I SAM-dependent methyltransferase [Gemmatimonadaceae bacterium]